ncbi:MAG: ribosomal protein S6--L-glutamate ligase [Patescibacteria group bacterium]|nr:ATP-grasp domain-containing protein [Candidatus Saccharibacteria bacterium]MDQ5963024.1 ribosomal protein S6--L-glutamate ligase [Patescibacteria group bacterium]
MKHTHKKDVLLLFSYDIYPSGVQRYTNHADILNEHGRNPDIQYHRSSLDDLLFVYDGDSLSVIDALSGCDISEFNMVVFNKWLALPQHAYATALYLQERETPFISGEIVQQAPLTKLSEFVRLVLVNIPYPKTVFASGKQLLGYIDKIPFDFPYIYKDIDASQGKRNYLVHNKKELVQLIQENLQRHFMLQEFIENDFDYRIAIFGGEIKYSIKRSRDAAKTHLNNTSQGSSAQFTAEKNLEAGVASLALLAAAALDRKDFCGADVLVGKTGELYILEVNRTPEIQTGFSISRKSELFTEYIEQLLDSSQRVENSET